MLQHEQAPPTAPLNYAPPNYTPITPQELAQAVVAVEERQGSGTQTTIDPAVIRQTLEQGRMNVTPEQLLKEVQMQRIIAHQDAVMTRRKTRGLAFWLPLTASVLAFFAILLLGAKYMVVVRQLGVSEAANKEYEKKEASTRGADASQVLQSWKYPGANIRPGGGSNRSSSVSMTTTDSFADIWRYYAEQTGGKELLRTLRTPIGADGQALSSSAVGSGEQGADYEFNTNSTPTGPMMTFSRHTPQYTVTGISIYDGASHAYNIHIVSSTP